MNRCLHVLSPLALALATLPAFAMPEQAQAFNLKPSFIGEILVQTYNAGAGSDRDDLLTAGLGRAGIQSPVAPTVSTPPTAAELRRRAIHVNYRALVDTSAAGGFGTLYGPMISVSADGTVTSPGDGRIAGTEHLAFADRRGDGANVTLMVQVPAHFNPQKPCIVTGTSSGSRGIYGAIGTSGEWGLQKGCAVAYSDKGSGNGKHDLATDTVGQIDGLRSDVGEAGADSHFTADLSPSERAAFLAAWPNRVAIKHAHSKRNPEADWGRDTLDAVRFAFYVLNDRYGVKTPKGTVRTIRPANTVVIAASVSNGAGAALAAAEQDSERLIDGIAVSEPQVQLQHDDRVTVRRGAQLRSGSGRPLYDYSTLANLLQPCATLSPRAAGSPFAVAVSPLLAANRCEALAARGLVDGDTPAARGDSALQALLDYGWEPESIPLTATHFTFAVPAVTLTYANSYGRFGVEERVCNYSYAAVAGTTPAPWSAADAALSFATGNGVPPSAGVQIINDAAVGGPTLDGASVSASTGKLDYNVDGALCLRELWTGGSVEAARVREGVEAVRVKGDLGGRPAIIVHGRADALVPVGFTSRPYLGKNQLAEGPRSKLRYIEVTNAQHFDGFIGLFPGYDTRYVPLHAYYVEALERMHAHLTADAPLPPSQVVRTTPRAGAPGAALAITAANVPPMSLSPAAADRITVRGGSVVVPD